MKSGQAGSTTRLDTPCVKFGYTGSTTWSSNFYGPNQGRKMQNSIKQSPIDLKFCTHLLYEEVNIITKFKLQNIKALVSNKVDFLVVVLKLIEPVARSVLRGSKHHKINSELSPKP